MKGRRMGVDRALPERLAAGLVALVAAAGLVAADPAPAAGQEGARVDTVPDPSSPGPEPAGRPAADPPGAGPEGDRFRTPARIAAEALPAVVEIVTYGESGAKLGGGSGFLAAPEGIVFTSHHVLEGARRAEVVLPTGETFDVVHVTAADVRTDLALLRIAGFDLPVVRLGDAREVAVGDPVVVIGSPLGLRNSVTDGLVSAKREMEGRRVLQLSAPISKGSSGGPVFDARGRVVGVLAGFYRQGQNVNFAVPIEYARGLLALPSGNYSVASVGRKRVSLLGDGRPGPDLSLQAVLRGEPVPGEDETPWALQPRRVDPERVKAEPATAPEQVEGLWELRELSRVPDTKSGVHRGVLASGGTGLAGTFFGSLVRDPEFDAAFEGDRVRRFDLSLEPEGRATLEGENGCSYFVDASPEAMTGVYECTGSDGRVYDLGAVEMRRIEGAGPSGVYEYVEEVPLGSGTARNRGRLLVFALPDGRWIGKLVDVSGRFPRVSGLEEGRWTVDGHLSARREGRGGRVRGSFTEGTIHLEYTVGGVDYRTRATLLGTRPEPSGPR